MMGEPAWGALPWSAKTRQQEGLKAEAKILKERGARQHPRSGAGSIKEDGSDDLNLYEVKNTKKKSFSLKALDLRASFNRACRQGKRSVWLIDFDDENYVAEIRLVPKGKA